MNRGFIFFFGCVLGSIPVSAETTYTVAPGDTLWSISHAHGCPLVDLEAVNHLADRPLHPGQVLHLPKPGETSSGSLASALSTSSTTDISPTVSAPSTTILGDDPCWDKASASSESDQLAPPESISRESEAEPPPSPPQQNWATRFLSASRALANRDLDYNESWRPPGEDNSWVMDCSNTCRYLYKSVAAIVLPRCASDQYEDLRLQDAAWDVPEDDQGRPDLSYLKSHLHPGDLLFWENTYKPERDPPITHVMIFLGTNTQGKWIMAGCQGGPGGHHNRRHGGPDIYFFNPQEPCGGYTSWLTHHTGRFCAYGRPLAADADKLALAASH